ncbi:MAG: CidA/LrgA family holin-like protein [Massilibacillus sp.]|nr:CidA/LrgA family holin-like protein [Massilibacillus sp.]
MKIVSILIQILGLCAISFAGNVLASALNIGIPGSILGILLLLVVIEQKWLPLEKIELGANFLIAEMLLFFIPSAIGVIQFQDVLKNDWAQLLFVIGASICLVVVFVGIVTEFIIRFRESRNAS